MEELVAQKQGYKWLERRAAHKAGDYPALNMNVFNSTSHSACSVVLFSAFSGAFEVLKGKMEESKTQAENTRKIKLVKVSLPLKVIKNNLDNIFHTSGKALL